MDIAKNIKIIDLALFLKKEKIIIFSDFHLGYDESLNKGGVLIPRFQFKDIMERLKKIIKKKKFKAIVINGDLKDEFGTISSSEWKQTLELLDYLSEHTKKIILIKGNHDVLLGPIAKKRNIGLKDYYKVGDVFITHGHKIPNSIELATSNIIVIGNEHPAISLSKENRVESFKCFLVGKWKNKMLIVLPSFNPITVGSDVLKEKFLSPFLNINIDNFNAYVVEDKVYNFGKIKKLQNL